MTKRELDVSDVNMTTIGKGATVHGMLTEVSPVKMSKTNDKPYYHGQITDGKKSVRFVSFDVTLKNTMDKAKEMNRPIAITNCSIQDSNKGYGLSIYANEQTLVSDSPKKFEISTIIRSDKVLDSLEEIKDIQVNQKVKSREYWGACGCIFQNSQQRS